MRFIYLIISIVLHPFLFFFLQLRIIKKKEDKFRFKEKLGQTKIKNIQNVIWFHVASLGEIKSIYPVIKHYQKNRSLKILVTSVTQSSYKFFEEKLKSDNTFHQYAPLDTPYIVKKFLNNWQPQLSIFVESEIWPNLIAESSKVSKLILLNCRISKNSFRKWKFIKKTFKKIMSHFSFITVQNNETAEFLNFLEIKNIKYFGNLKFVQVENKKKELIQIKNIKNSWAAMSIHFEEIDHILNTHEKLVSYYKSFLTFIIPRHLNKINEIEVKMQNLNINYQKISDTNVIDNFNGIVLVDKFGFADDVFQFVNCVFMGGSFIDHGGQNPIEPLRYGCNILSGKYIFNFTEIYNNLEKKGFAELIMDPKNLAEKVQNKINHKRKDSEQYLKLLSEDIMKKNISFLDSQIY